MKGFEHGMEFLHAWQDPSASQLAYPERRFAHSHVIRHRVHTSLSTFQLLFMAPQSVRDELIRAIMSLNSPQNCYCTMEHDGHMSVHARAYWQ